MTRNLTCIICPRGCSMTADITPDGVKVTGHTCPKGEEYAINECTNPVRTVTATVRVANRENTMVSVKTEAPVPKGEMLNIMALLRKTQIDAPVRIGDVVLSDICGTNIVVTKDIA